jgi:hypothetical protein
MRLGEFDSRSPHQFRSLPLAARRADLHSDNTGSSPVGSTNTGEWRRGSATHFECEGRWFDPILARIAGSMASGIIEYLAEGAWTKRMHAGWAAQSRANTNADLAGLTRPRTATSPLAGRREGNHPPRTGRVKAGRVVGKISSWSSAAPPSCRSSCHRHCRHRRSRLLRASQSRHWVSE